MHGKTLGVTVLEFWQWSGPNLMDNTMRGLLAESIVAKGLGASTECIRDSWSLYDFGTPGGFEIQVKSSSYIQNWAQEVPSKMAN